MKTFGRIKIIGWYIVALALTMSYFMVDSFGFDNMKSPRFGFLLIYGTVKLIFTFAGLMMIAVMSYKLLSR